MNHFDVGNNMTSPLGIKEKAFCSAFSIHPVHFFCSVVRNELWMNAVVTLMLYVPIIYAHNPATCLHAAVCQGCLIAASPKQMADVQASFSLWWRVRGLFSVTGYFRRIVSLERHWWTVLMERWTLLKPPWSVHCHARTEAHRLAFKVRTRFLCVKASCR